MGESSIDTLHDPYEEQLSAARFKAERDAAVQELQGLRERNIELWMESGMANELVTCAEQKAERLGKLVWRLQNRLARSHRRERNLRKGMRMWREKAIDKPQVTMSAYDLLPEADLETLRWVREQGGLDALKAYTDCFSNLLRECHGYRDLARDYEKRIMPEGYEWPRWDDNEPITYTDSPEDVCGIFFALDASCYALMRDVPDDALETGERVRRPAVLAADGEPLEVGQTVWHVSNGVEFTVVGLPKSSEYQAVKLRLDDGAFTGFDPDQLTHQRPVLDADGVPIHEGDTVWNATTSARPLTVREIERSDDPDEPEDLVWCGERAANGFKVWRIADQLAHTKPEPDSWSSVWADVSNGNETPEGMMRRCQALAERGE